MLQQGFDVLGGAGGVAPFETLVGEAGQALGGGFAIRDFRGVFVAQLVELEGEAVCKSGGAVDGIGVGAEEAAHLGFRPKALFGIGKRGAAEVVDLAAGADGGEHVGQLAAVAVVHERRGTGDGGDGEVLGEAGEPVETGGVLAVVFRGKEEVAVFREAARQPFRLCEPPARAGLCRLRPWRVEQQRHVGAEREEVVEGEAAGAFFGPQPTARDQAAEVAPAGAGLRQRGDGDAGVEDDAGAGDQPGHVEDGG